MTIPRHEQDRPTFRAASKEALLFLLRPIVRWLSVRECPRVGHGTERLFVVDHQLLRP